MIPQLARNELGKYRTEAGSEKGQVPYSTGLREVESSSANITASAALSECGGRVYGPSGAAAKLGIPRSTLESKIRSLKIDKNRFDADGSSKKNS
jgi:DNA-binding NtrC family response regulator